MKRRTSWVAVAALFAVSASSAVLAQTYPNKVIRLQVPFAPGGTTDIVARVISEPLGKALGQSVIVENKAGRRHGNCARNTGWLFIGHGHCVYHGSQSCHQP